MTAATTTSRPISRRAALRGAVGVAAMAWGGRAAVAGAATSAAADLQALLDRSLAANPDLHALALHLSSPALPAGWSGAAGLFDRATGEPLRPDDGFRIASNTKTFTAAATLRLMEEGKLDLDRPIADFLPAEHLALLTTGGYDPGAITVRHCLVHSSGLYDYSADTAFQFAVLTQAVTHWSRLDQIRFAVEHGAPYNAPGERFHYSDTGYVVLGEIVERVNESDLATAYQGLLGFDRLGLGGTYLETEGPVPPTAGRRAHQYYGEIDTTDLDPSFDLYGGGGLVSTVADLGRFYRALFRGEVYRKPETLATMTTIPPSSGAAEAAMGLFRVTWGELTFWAHGGFWGSMAMYDPERDVATAFSINQGGDDVEFNGDAFLTELVAIAAPQG